LGLKDRETSDLQSKYNISLNEAKAPVDTSEIESKFKEQFDQKQVEKDKKH